MFIVINEDKVKTARTLKSINKKLKTSFKKDEFKKYNSDYVLNLSNEDLDYKRDSNELNRIFVSKLYKKDINNLINYGFFAISIVMMLIILTLVSSTNETLSMLLQQLEMVVIKWNYFYCYF